MKKILTLVWLLCPLTLYSQERGRGQGSSGSVEPFQKITLQLQQLPEARYPVSGKKLGEVLPQKIFGRWAQVEYQVAEDVDVEKVMPFLAKIVLHVLEKDNDLAFLSYEKTKSEAIDRPITIDSRITIRFHRDREHPLLGSKYIVFNVDSTRKLAHVKWDQEVGGVLSIDL